MVGYTQTGKRILLTGILPKRMGLYWFCDGDTVAARIANVGWDGMSFFAREVISGETIPEFEFCDYLWCEASERDAEDMRKFHTLVHQDSAAV